MLVDILQITEMMACLRRPEQLRLREISRSFHSELRHLRLRECGPLSEPSVVRYFWIEDEEYQSVRWKQKFPSILPRALWSPLWIWINDHLTVWTIRPWLSIKSRPIFYDRGWTDRIGMEMDVPANAWVAIGVCWGEDRMEIVGFDHCSIGFHSDDNCVYHDSLLLMKNHCVNLPPVEKIGCTVDYTDATMSFYRNDRLEFIWDMDGVIISRPFAFCVSSNDTDPGLYRRCIITDKEMKKT